MIPTNFDFLAAPLPRLFPAALTFAHNSLISPALVTLGIRAPGGGCQYLFENMLVSLKYTGRISTEKTKSDAWLACVFEHVELLKNLMCLLFCNFEIRALFGCFV